MSANIVFSFEISLIAGSIYSSTTNQSKTNIIYLISISCHYPTAKETDRSVTRVYVPICKCIPIVYEPSLSSSIYCNLVNLIVN